jgi:hypothetical protein
LPAIKPGFADRAEQILPAHVGGEQHQGAHARAAGTVLHRQHAAVGMTDDDRAFKALPREPAFRVLVVLDHLVDALVGAAHALPCRARQDVVAAAVKGEHGIAQLHQEGGNMARHAGVEVSAIPVHDENGAFAGARFRPIEHSIERIGAGFDRHKLQPHRFTLPPTDDNEPRRQS